MIVDVLPLRTLPRGLDFFSYSVPAHLATQIQAGQCLKIPFRSQTIIGVALKIRSGSEKNLKTITEIINPVPLLGADYLLFLEQLAAFYGLSHATLVKSALPPLQPNKIGLENITPWRTIKKSSGQPQYVWYKNLDEQTDSYHQYSQERIAIIVPEIKDVATVLAALPADRQAQALVWTSHNSQKIEREQWFTIRNGQATTLIATRSALWLPLCQSFDRIIIEYEGDHNHKHTEQAPRFTTRDVAKLHAKNFGLHYTEAGFSPSVASYFFISEKKYSLVTKPESRIQTPITVILPDSNRAVPIFSPTLETIKKTIATSPTKDIVLIFNQTKPGKTGICRGCLQLIPTPLPELCPHCGNTNLVTIGHTINSVASFLKKELPQVAEQIITVDKETELTASTSGRIVIGTWAVLAKISWANISLVALLDFTRQAIFAEYITHEDLHYRIKQLQFFVLPNTPILIQSESSEHPLLQALTNDARWYETQLFERSQLDFPPYAYVVRYLVPGPTDEQALHTAQTVIKRLQQALTSTPKKCIIQGPLLANGHWQNKAWAIIMVKLTEPDILTSVIWLNQFFPTPIKIDPNPISVTSPH